MACLRQRPLCKRGKEQFIDGARAHCSKHLRTFQAPYQRISCSPSNKSSRFVLCILIVRPRLRGQYPCDIRGRVLYLPCVISFSVFRLSHYQTSLVRAKLLDVICAILPMHTARDESNWRSFHPVQAPVVAILWIEDQREPFSSRMQRTCFCPRSAVDRPPQSRYPGLS